MIGLIRNFSRSPLLFPPVELIALEKWSGGELGAEFDALPQFPLPAEMRWERKRRRRMNMCVGGDDGTVCRAGRCTAERKEQESEDVWVRGGETDNRNLSGDTSVHCVRKQLPNGLLSFGPFSYHNWET